MVDLPIIQMSYYNEKALLPLPQTPADGSHRGLSFFQEIITDNIDIEEGEDEVFGFRVRFEHVP